MLPRTLLALAALVAGAAASPAQGLRLIKTAENDPGVWVTEQEKFERFVSKHVHFVDATDTPDLEALGAARAADTFSAAAIPTAPSHQAEAAPLIAALRQSNLQTWATALANFYNRYYKNTTYGVQAATWVFDTVKSVAAANPRITVEQVTHSGFAQKSTIARIPGTGSGIVVVSAHFDSVGSTASGRAPGADDNASGVVTILEALRVLANAGYAPRNTLEFHFYAGEEGGLLGSRAIMNSYASAGKNVLALMNQDMTGYSPNNVIAVYTDYVHAGLTNFIRALVPVYTALPVITDRCGYACSDHGSAHSAGFPAAYVADDNMQDSSPYIHSAQDTLSTLSYPHILEHAKLTVGFLVEGAYF